MEETKTELQLIKMSEIQSQEVSWLWFPFILYGKLTIVQGDPGDGKTTFVLNIAAKLSKGEGIDSEMKLTEPLNVIYQSAEDGLADTIKPRLEQAGADCEKISVSMRVQSLNRTLIDKVFAVCDYYLQNKAHRNARHLYDIYKLTEHVEMNNDFLELVKEVRAHRIAMGSEIAPAASLDVNILELVQKICNEDFYKKDYRETTLKLISDSLEYEMLKMYYKELVEKMFK